MPTKNDSQNKSSWEAQYEKGCRALDSGKVELAIELLIKAAEAAEKLELTDYHLHSLLTLGDAFKIGGDYDRATKIFRLVESEAVKNGNLLYFMALANGAIGMMRMGQRDVKGALEALEATATLIKRMPEQLPEFVPLIIGLAGVYSELNQIEKADKVCRYALDYAKNVLEPDDASILTAMNLCALYAEYLGKPKRAATLRSQIDSLTNKTAGARSNKLGLAPPPSKKQQESRPLSLVMDDEIQSGKAPQKPKLTTVKSNVVALGKNAKGLSKEKSLKKADDIVIEAWELSDRRREKMAKEALTISPDCANAYLLLADSARRSADKIALLRQAIAAAERSLPADWQKKYKGDCWQFLETRPMLRAMAALARELQLNDELDEALKLNRKLLELTPGDNQGIRYQLATCLFQAHCDAELEKLLKSYADDPTAIMAYTKALHLFRKEGASPGANAALSKAFACNPSVPIYLSDIVEIPDISDGTIGIGDETEAASYYEDSRFFWADTDGALPWMAQQLEPAMRKLSDSDLVDEVLAELRLD